MLPSVERGAKALSLACGHPCGAPVDRRCQDPRDHDL